MYASAWVHVVGLFPYDDKILGFCWAIGFRRSNEVVRASGALSVRGLLLPLSRSEHNLVDLWSCSVDVWFILLVTWSSIV